MARNSTLPNRAVMGVTGMPREKARQAANLAVLYARRNAPKLTVASSTGFSPIWDEGWFGVAWEHDYVFFQEVGIKPFTMRSLANKTIPMWIDDPNGEEAAKNPKAKTRVLPSGRRQVLIFRRAAKMGQRKDAWRNVGGRMTRVSVPASFPGAPGRIAVNRSRGILRAGDVDPNAPNPGQIAPRNVGVRWRHPGLRAERFLAKGIEEAARKLGLPRGAVIYRQWWVNSTSDPSYHPIVYQA